MIKVFFSFSSDGTSTLNSKCTAHPPCKHESRCRLKTEHGRASHYYCNCSSGYEGRQCHQGELTICEATAKSTKLRKKSNPTRASFIRKKKRFCLLQPYLVWKYLSHWSRKTSRKVRGTLKSLPKVVSKRIHQEECVQSAKTAKSVASCVASQVLQVADKLPSFPRKAEFSQIER